MTKAVLRSLNLGLLSSLVLMLGCSSAVYAQNTDPIRSNAGQASQPSATSGLGSPAPATNTTPPAPNAAAGAVTTPTTGSTPSNGSSPANSANTADDNPFNPYVEPPPLPKGKATLIGGTATSVDKVRNRVTVQPFGKGTKIKLILDERSHIYRDGTETTILGVHKGDHIYVDTMLDGSKVFARNLRVVTETGPAEVRGQVVAADLGSGKISVKDELSSHPVTFSVNNATKYSSFRGAASSSDLRPGSLIDVQFALDQSNRDVAQEITVLAKPGENYIFSGTVTSLDMRSGTLAVDNSSDDQNYEIHFDPATMADSHGLKVGSEVTARTVFDGKVYKASNLTVEQPAPKEGDQSKVQ